MSYLLKTPFPIAPLRRFVIELTDGPFGSSLTSSHYSEDGARVIRLGNIGSAKFKSDDEAYIPLDYFYSLRRHEVAPGDLIIAGLGDQNHPVGRACVAPTELGPAIVKADCFRARLDESRLLHRYSAWALSSSAISQQILTLTRGTTRARINLDLVRNIELPVPSVEEQRCIADFLDAETARIDLVAELRRKQRDLLTSRRWSHFQEILDAATGPVIPLRRLVRSIIDGPFGSAFSSDDYAEDGAAVVRLGNIGFAEYRPTDQAYIPMNLYRKFRYHQVNRGDVLIAGLGDARNHAGRACVAPDLGPAIVKGKCFRARLETEAADADFVALLLSSPVGASAIEGRGSTRSMINLEIVKAALLPIPDLRKQRSVVAEHRQAWKQSKAAVDACERQLDLLAERRQALITAAVTGQFDVTAASGRNVTEGVAV